MKKNHSKKFLALKKASIAQLNENEMAILNGGSSSGTTVTSSFTVTLISDCTSIKCIPIDE